MALVKEVREPEGWGKPRNAIQLARTRRSPFINDSVCDGEVNKQVSRASKPSPSVAREKNVKCS